MSLDVKSIRGIVKVLHLTREVVGEKYFGHFHGHDYFEVLVFHSAVGILHMIDFEDYSCGSGDVFLLHPNQIHKFNAQSGASHEMTVLQIESKYLFEVVAGSTNYSDLLKKVFYFKNKLRLGNESNAKALNIIRQIDVETKSMKNHYPSVIGNYLHILFIELDRAIGSVSEGRNPKNALLNGFWLVLEEMYHQNFTIDDISDKLNISSRQLHRIVFESTYISPKKHKDERLSLQAKRMLYGSEKSIKAIAYELGFGDLSNFTKFFIRKNHVSPTQFRKKCLKNTIYCPK